VAGRDALGQSIEGVTLCVIAVEVDWMRHDVWEKESVSAAARALRQKGVDVRVRK